VVIGKSDLLITANRSPSPSRGSESSGRIISFVLAPLAFERCGGPEGLSISDIVKRKHIRSNRSTGDGNGRTDSNIRSPITVLPINV
jgi:hypothetical protein